MAVTLNVKTVRYQHYMTRSLQLIRRKTEKNKGKRLVESDDEQYEVTNEPNEMYNMLVTPFADRIEGREVVLVPEGSLYMVPFSALQDDEGQYLSEK